MSCSKSNSWGFRMFSKEIQIEAVSLYLKGVPTVIIRKKFEIKGSGTTSVRAYFTAYIDVYSGEILTWNIDLHPTVEFVTKPLDELLQNRPDLNYRMTIHSDQGFQYQNYEYVSRLKNNRMFQSMSRKATCLDNAMAESIFHIVKIGTIHNNHYQSYDELKSAITSHMSITTTISGFKTKLAGKTPVQYRNLSDQLAA